MLFKIVLVVVAATVVLGKPWEITRKPDGSYIWNYKNPDGAEQQESSNIQSDGNPFVTGFVRWYDPEGNLHQIKYKAGVNGSSFNSNDLPHNSWDFRRALRWNEAHPEEE